MTSGNTDAIRLLDMAGVEWVKTKAGPLRKNVEEFLDSHGLREEPEPREPEDPDKVVVFDPSRVRHRPERQEDKGAEAPGKGAA